MALNMPSEASANSPYEILGVRESATEEELRAAYRTLAKRLHPDVCDSSQKEWADREMAALNGAYAKACQQLRQHSRPCVDPLRIALRLYEQKLYSDTLRILDRADTRGIDWYTLRGKTLMHLHRPAEAEPCFRRAIALGGDERSLRALALEASLSSQKQKTVIGRTVTAFRNGFHKILKDG